MREKILIAVACISIAAAFVFARKASDKICIKLIPVGNSNISGAGNPWEYK